MGEGLGNGWTKGDIVGNLIGVFNGGILLFYLRECEGACILYIGGAQYLFFFFIFIIMLVGFN